MNSAAPNDAFQVLVKHQQNIATSLLHRLESARASHNTQLLALLEQEQQQLARMTPSQTGISHLLGKAKKLWHQVIDSFFSPEAALEVRQVIDHNGILWWYAYEPRTGRCVYATSEAEAVNWIEENHWQD
jgi:hypothetical protein